MTEPEASFPIAESKEPASEARGAPLEPSEATAAGSDTGKTSTDFRASLPSNYSRSLCQLADKPVFDERICFTSLSQRALMTMLSLCSLSTAPPLSAPSPLAPPPAVPTGAVSAASPSPPEPPAATAIAPVSHATTHEPPSFPAIVASAIGAGPSAPPGLRQAPPPGDPQQETIGIVSIAAEDAYRNTGAAYKGRASIAAKDYTYTTPLFPLSTAPLSAPRCSHCMVAPPDLQACRPLINAPPPSRGPDPRRRPPTLAASPHDRRRMPRPDPPCPR
jgi:hypothetical protein